MASELIARLKSEIESLKQSIAVLKKDLKDIQDEQLAANVALRAAQAAGNTDEISAQQEKLRNLRDEAFRDNAQLESYQFRLTNAQVELSGAEQFNQVTQPQPGETAARTVQDDATPNPARKPALEVGPDGRVQATGAVSSAPTNAESTPTGPASTGTDQPVKTFATTQATTDQNGNNVGIPLRDETGATGTIRRNPETGELYDSGGIPVADTSRGAGQQDDNPNNLPGSGNNESTTTTVVNNGFNKDEKIEPQPNLLDKFVNTTYSASVYLLNADQYTTFVARKERRVNGYNLLFQSGGAPSNVGGVKGALGQDAQNSIDATGSADTAVSYTTPGINDPDAGRNPFFTEDFYIDSISLESVFPGKQTQAAHMASNLKFTVIEPNGITLIDRLYQAVQDNAPRDATGTINYTAAQYLMVIRWYGYDSNGKPIKIGGAGDTGVSDPNAVVEKFIPFIIRGINWSVSNKVVTYEFDCAPVGQLIAGSTARGTVPYDIELRESTVGGLIAGAAAFSQTNAASNNAADANRSTASTTGTTPAPSTANTAPTPKTVLTGGLVDAMNKFQQELVDVKKVYTYADTYEVVFASGAEAIRDAKIALPGAVKNKSSTPMAAAPSKDANSKDPARQKVDSNAKKVNIVAGQQMLQVIDQAIRNSSFIYNQAALQNAEKVIDAKKLLEDEKSDPSKDNKVPPTTTVLWYQITMEATPKPNSYDIKRNDYAYNIRYIISVYPLQNFNSRYYPVPKFRGIHKQYRYWFTGENIDVLDYTANFNSLYQMTVSGREPNDSNLNKIRAKYISSMRELPKYVYSAASSETRAGAENQANEIAANAAEALYSPSDLANCKLKIVGDPAWIQQGSVAFGVDPLKFDYTPFLPDGTINFDAEQCLFAIEWQRPRDYNLRTGLADPYNPGDKDRKPVNSVVYQAVKCVSEFRQGRFEQTIDGTIYLFPVPSKVNTASQSQTSITTSPDELRESLATSERPAGATTAVRAEPAVINNTQTASTPDSNTSASDANIGRAQVGGATDATGEPLPVSAGLPAPARLPSPDNQQVETTAQQELEQARRDVATYERRLSLANSDPAFADAAPRLAQQLADAKAALISAEQRAAASVPPLAICADPESVVIPTNQSIVRTA